MDDCRHYLLGFVLMWSQKTYYKILEWDNISEHVMWFQYFITCPTFGFMHLFTLIHLIVLLKSVRERKEETPASHLNTKLAYDRMSGFICTHRGALQLVPDQALCLQVARLLL